MTRPSFRFGRKERLKGRGQIKRVFVRGRRFSCPGAKLLITRNELAVNRVVFTFPRKYGNAVMRNRSRRLSREAYRLVSSRLKPGYDLAVLIYPGMDVFAARIRQLDTLFSKAGLFA